MANYYVSPPDYLLVAQYANSTAYSVGQIIRQLATPTLGNERCFRCTTAGTTGGSEPAWNLGANATTTAGTAVFTECTGQEAYNSAWQAPAALTSLYMAQTTGRATSADSVFLREGGTETYTSNQTWTLTANMVAVVRTASSIPPVSADLKTTPAYNITTSGATSITLSNTTQYSGIAWKMGSGASTANLNFGAFSGGGPMRLKDCSVELANSSASSVWGWSASASSNTPAYDMNNVTFKVGNASQKITLAADADVLWRNTPSAIQGSTIPTTLFSIAGGAQIITLDGVGLEALNTTIITIGSGSTQTKVAGQASNCQLNSGVTVFGGTSQLLPFGSYFNFDNCSDSTNKRTFQMARATTGGAGPGVVTDTQMARTGGASGNANGSSVGYSWRANLSVGGQATLTKSGPWVSPWITKYNTALGSPITLTIHVLSNYATAPDNSQVFVNLKALTSANAPLSAWTTTQADFLPTTTPTTLTADTAAQWNAGTLASRANSTGYSVGDYIKVSSAPGQVFVCTTNGTSSGSLPAGYASCADGSSVTDGSAVFRALYRRKIAITFTPNFEGFFWLQAAIFTTTLAGPVWFDPLIDVA